MVIVRLSGGGSGNKNKRSVAFKMKWGSNSNHSHIACAKLQELALNYSRQMLYRTGVAGVGGKGMYIRKII